MSDIAHRRVLNRGRDGAETVFVGEAVGDAT